MSIFKEINIGKIKLGNRIIRSATHEGMAEPDGSPSFKLLEYYKRLAKGGVGAIITGYAGVKQNGKTFTNMLMFSNKEHIEKFKRITAEFKDSATPLILQLVHGGSLSNSAVSGEDVIGPSFKKKNVYGDICREATESEIMEIRGSFVNAIKNAEYAGFSGVQLHAAHGYLLSEFISPGANKRTDKWGGDLPRRLRLIKEIILSAKKEVGEFPIIIKIGAFDESPNGINEKEVIELSRLLEEYGATAVEVSCGYGDLFNTVRMRAFPEKAIFTMVQHYRDMPQIKKKVYKKLVPRIMMKYQPIYNYNVKMAQKIKKNINIPVIVVGGIRKLEDIEDIIEKKGIDFVSMSRPFIIEPDIVNKFKGRLQDESRCINCGYCLFGVMERSIRCYYGKVA